MPSPQRSWMRGAPPTATLRVSRCAGPQLQSVKLLHEASALQAQAAGQHVLDRRHVAVLTPLSGLENFTDGRLQQRCIGCALTVMASRGPHLHVQEVHTMEVPMAGMEATLVARIAATKVDGR